MLSSFASIILAGFLIFNLNLVRPMARCSIAAGLSLLLHDEDSVRVMLVLSHYRNVLGCDTPHDLRKAIEIFCQYISSLL